MKDRIKAVRLAMKLTQTEFGERIGVKGNTITNYETGLRNPSDAVITSIVREFGVSESWLRTGDGEMLRNFSREEELGQLIRRMLDRPDSFCTRLVSVLVRFDPDDPRWSLLEEIVDQVVAAQRDEQ